MAELRAHGLTVEAGGRRLLDDASIVLRGGELVAVIGENGAGKSTLLRSITGYRSAGGHVDIDGQSLASLSASERARRVAWLPQSAALAWPVRVRDAVALGRFAHGGPPGRLSAADRVLVNEALARCELTTLAEQSTATLSGGELARVHLARVLVTGAPLLLADEPVAALDPRHRLAVMTMLRAMVAAGSGALVVLHDLSLAARFADRVIAMQDGRIVAEGPVARIVTPMVLERLFGVPFAVTDDRGWPEPIALG